MKLRTGTAYDLDCTWKEGGRRTEFHPWEDQSLSLHLTRTPDSQIKTPFDDFSAAFEHENIFEIQVSNRPISCAKTKILEQFKRMSSNCWRV